MRTGLAGGSALACGLALLMVAPVRANDRTPADSDPNQVTVTATRTPIAVEDAPVTVTVIDRERIADELAQDIRDLVRFEPGISVPRQPARFGAALGATGRAGNEGFVVRGIGGNRVLIQVDGVRVPDGFTFGAQAAGRGDYVDLGLVKSVEILRGPASALYGSDGLAGAVSFITSDPSDFLTDGTGIAGLARAAYKSASNEFAETAILAAGSDRVSAMVAYTRRDFDALETGGDRDVIGAGRTTANPQDGRSNAVLGRVVFQPGAGHTLRLTGEYLDNRLVTDVLSGRSASVDLLLARDTGRRARVAGDWTWEGAGSFDYARLSAYWQDAEDRQFTREDRTPAADRTRLNSFENRVYGIAGEARFAFDTGTLRHRLVIGADASRLRQEGLRDGTVPPAGETFPARAFPRTDFTLAGAFVSDEITAGPLTLFPSLRFDHYRLSPQVDALLPRFRAAAQDGSRVSPKIGAVVRVRDGIRLFANYAHGFKAPEPSQVNQFFENLGFGYTSRPNPDLRPETSRSAEGGVRLSHAGLSLDLTGFRGVYRGFISQEVVLGGFTPRDPAIYQFVNLNRVVVKGGEARFEGRAANGLTGSLAISFADGEVTSPAGVRSPLSTVDPLKLVAGIGYRDAGGRFGGQLIATHSGRKERGRTLGLCTGECFRPAAFTLLDATVFARVTDAVTLRAGVFNITDAKYSWWSDVRGLAASSTITDAYTGPGRNGSVSVSLAF